MSEPIEDHVREAMIEVGEVIAEVFKPEGYGFVLLSFSLCCRDGRDGRMNYISNSNRADVIKAMKEFIENVEAEEN